MKNNPRTGSRVINPPALPSPNHRDANDSIPARLSRSIKPHRVPTDRASHATHAMFSRSPPTAPRKADQRARQATAHIHEIRGAGATGGTGLRHTGRLSKAFRGHTRPSSKGAHRRRTTATESGEGVFRVARSKQHCPSPSNPVQLTKLQRVTEATANIAFHRIRERVC